MALDEYADGDEWQAILNTDDSLPGSEIELVNEATGEVLGISLKATASPAAFTRVLGDSGVALAAR